MNDSVKPRLGAPRGPRHGNYKHGLWKHPLYGTWVIAMHRCENPRHRDYKYYGGRGITICERWHDVRLFIEDIEAEIGPRPEGKYPSGRPMYTLDRIDNDGNYEPGNLRWAAKSEQAINRRPASTPRRRPNQKPKAALSGRYLTVIHP